MRVPRSIQLYEESGYIHLFWRCHNREFYLTEEKIKNLYLICIKNALAKLSNPNSIRINSFCVMNNHFHMVASYTKGSPNLSEFMRKAHGSFGRLYNKLHRRSGKVAEGRPKTPLIENTEHLARVQFYVEANPIRSGMVPINKLRFYKYSTYSYFAFGIKCNHHYLIKTPDWYLELGKTARERQREYRRLFLKYLEETKTGFNNFLKSFIGSPVWVLTQRKRAVAEIIGSKSPLENINSS